MLLAHARVVVRKYGVDKAISQFYTKYITKLSFFLKITQFLVCEPFFFYHRGNKVSSRRAKHFCLSPCVVPKNLFLEKIAPYTRDAHACKWSGSRVEKLEIFSTRSKWRPNFKIQSGNQSARCTH